MKSRFFGVSAKFALAALAVGFTFASCYDSTNESVVVPTPDNGGGSSSIVLPAPSYQVYGYVYDYKTDEPVVGVTVNTPLGAAVTDATGYYQAVSNTAANGTVTFSKDGYETYTATLNVVQIGLGAAIYNVSIYLVPEGVELEVVLTDTDAASSAEAASEGIVDVLTVAEAVSVANTSAEPVVQKVIVPVKEGIRWNENTDTRATFAEAMEVFVDYIYERFGLSITADFTTSAEEVELTVPGNATLAALMSLPQYVTETYEVDGRNFIIDRIVGKLLTPLYISVVGDEVDENALAEVANALIEGEGEKAVELFEDLLKEQEEHNGGTTVAE